MSLNIYTIAKGYYDWLFRRRIARTSPGQMLVFYIIVGVIAFVSVYPFYVMVRASLLPTGELYSLPPNIFVNEIVLSHYTSLSTKAFPFFTFMLNSFIVALVTATLSTVLAIFGAYSFARLEYPGREIFSVGVIVVYMFSGILLVVPLFQVLLSLNLVNTRIGIILTHMVLTLPLTLYILRNYFRSVPPEIEEAAIVDGYSRIEVIFRIMLPMSLPAIASGFVYAFLISWNEYLFASIILKSKTLYTVPFGIQQISLTTMDNIMGQLMAASVISTLPVIILFYYMQTYIGEGIGY